MCGDNYEGPITNCYYLSGTVADGKGGIGGKDDDNGNAVEISKDRFKSGITNCYYLSGTVADGKGGIGGKDDDNGNAVEISKDRFKSGEVAWLLNGSKSVSTEESTLAWYQKLGENADAYPVLKSTDNIGGVCGYNYGGTIKSCYNTASVSGQYSVGGVCGDNYEGPITNCYYLSGTVADGKGGIGGKDDENGKAVEMSKDRFKVARWHGYLMAPNLFLPKEAPWHGIRSWMRMLTLIQS